MAWFVDSSIGAFPKQFLKPFGLDLAEAFSRLPSSELRYDSQLLVVQVLFSFLYFSTDNLAFLAFQIAIPI